MRPSTAWPGKREFQPSERIASLPTLTRVQIRAIADDIREEIRKRQANPAWRGGTIPSNFKSFFADVDPEGNFKKIFFKQGGKREFFVLK